MPAMIVILKNKRVAFISFNFSLVLLPLSFTVNKTGVSLSLEI